MCLEPRNLYSPEKVQMMCIHILKFNIFDILITACFPHNTYPPSLKISRLSSIKGGIVGGVHTYTLGDVWRWKRGGEPIHVGEELRGVAGAP